MLLRDITRYYSELMTSCSILLTRAGDGAPAPASSATTDVLTQVLTTIGNFGSVPSVEFALRRWCGPEGFAPLSTAVL